MRVLVATDGSEPARIGLELVAGLAWPAGTVIRVAMAIDTSPALFGGPWPAAALVQAGAIETALRANAGQVVEEAAAALRRGGLTVEPLIAEGRPAQSIVDQASRFGAELIVVGARGHGAIESMVLGSVSAEVVDTAPVPVLVARSPRLRRIVLASDGSPSSDLAARVLETWSIFHGAAVRVVTVTEPDVPWWAGLGPDASAWSAMPSYVEALDAVREEYREHATRRAAGLRAAGFEADVEVRAGDAAGEILAATNAWSADLIVVGTRGRSGFAGLALGSVARNVVHHGRASVLVVRPPAAMVSAQ
jgi:nucleotide-binding universal stress UspA family protein